MDAAMDARVDAHVELARRRVSRAEQSTGQILINGPGLGVSRDAVLDMMVFARDNTEIETHKSTLEHDSGCVRRRWGPGSSRGSVSAASNWPLPKRYLSLPLALVLWKLLNQR